MGKGQLYPPLPAATEGPGTRGTICPAQSCCETCGLPSKGAGALAGARCGGVNTNPAPAPLKPYSCKLSITKCTRTQAGMERSVPQSLFQGGFSALRSKELLPSSARGGGGRTASYPARRSWCLAGRTWQRTWVWAWPPATPRCPSACRSAAGSCAAAGLTPSHRPRRLCSLDRAKKQEKKTTTKLLQESIRNTPPAKTDHRITESQNSRGWKGPLWVI